MLLFQIVETNIHIFKLHRKNFQNNVDFLPIAITSKKYVETMSIT